MNWPAAALVIVAALVVAVVLAAGLTPEDWKPRRMREAEQPLWWERDLDPGADDGPGASEGAGK